jgi:hypothetical protein
VHGIGTFTWRPRRDAWVWNDAMYRLHGYAPQAVVPSHALVMAHEHPEDRLRVGRTMVTVLRDGGTFTCAHRIVTVDGKVRPVVTAGRLRSLPGGPALLGHVIAQPDEADAAGSFVATPTSDHDQLLTGGQATLVRTGLTPLAAEAVLSWLADDHEVPPVVVAERLVAWSDDGVDTLGGLLAALDVDRLDEAHHAGGPGRVVPGTAG